MITVEEIQEIKRKAEQKRREVERAKGSLEQLMEILRKDYECDTIEQANDKLEKLKEKGQQISDKIEKMKSRVVELWNQIENPKEDAQ